MTDTPTEAADRLNQVCGSSWIWIDVDAGGVHHIAREVLQDIRALLDERDAAPQWRERPTCEGIWLTCEHCSYRYHRIHERDLAEWKAGECYGPIPKATNDEFPHVSAVEAFAALREASGGRWDNVDPEEFVRELRRDDEPLPPDGKDAANV